MTIMMKLFRKKNRNIKGIVEAQLAGAEVPAADGSGSHSAPTTFSNPFGLGQSESLAQPTVGDYGGSSHQGNGRSEENGAPNVHAVPAVPEAVAPTAIQDKERDESCETPVEPVESVTQAEQPETFADMQGTSTDRPFNPLAPIWADAPGEALSDERNLTSERPIESEPLTGFADPDWNRSETREDGPFRG